MKEEKIHNIKNSGFKTPDNYFDSFENQLLERLNENKMISATQASGFNVPEDYFESVETSILKQLEPKPESPVISLKPKRKFYYVAGIAASIVLLFSLFINQENQININTIETDSIENYLYQEAYSNDDFASLFQDDEISETDFIDLNVSDETLNEFLENVETEDFILD
ncbi:hypothetical protein [Winogradskyella vidalii]|uniref:hypothetical protein n=1 Tax=Winogradskyella vidalii TaxID=2615024 RepID=UPI0015CAE04A|nr:hypothetical protein [Winogradskyella vidalii]